MKARYSRHYRISGEQLDWLTERVQLLRNTVCEVCEQRIASLVEAA